MKNVTLKVTEIKGKFLHQVIDENGNVICGSQMKSRKYAAVYFGEWEGGYGIYFFFGKVELIGKGNSKKWAAMMDKEGQNYAVAMAA